MRAVAWEVSEKVVALKEVSCFFAVGLSSDLERRRLWIVLEKAAEASPEFDDILQTTQKWNWRYLESDKT